MPLLKFRLIPECQFWRPTSRKKCSNTSIAKREETLNPLYWLLEQNHVRDHFQPADMCSTKSLKQTQVLILNGLDEGNSY